MDLKLPSGLLRDFALMTVCSLGAVFIVLLWLSDDGESVDDFTVTIDCRYVVMNPDEFPDIVLNECRDKVRFIEAPTSVSI